SYSPYVGWALHINFGPYQLPWRSTGTTHFTANSYDRHVPLDLYGTPFVPGTYHGVVAPVDIAATLASLLRINRPSAAVGRVLTECVRRSCTCICYSQSPGCRAALLRKRVPRCRSRRARARDAAPCATAPPHSRCWRLRRKAGRIPHLRQSWRYPCPGRHSTNA